MPAKSKKKSDIRPTGIKSLDTILGGGLPEGATVYLGGDAGVGKTTLAAQWLFEGYRNYEETGVYVTLTEPSTVLIKNFEKMSFFDSDYIATSDVGLDNLKSELVARPGIHIIDLRQILEEMKLLKTDYTYKDVDKILDVLFEVILNTSVNRMVVDSITALAYLLKDKSLIRTFIYKMGKMLSLSDANTLLIGEIADNDQSTFGVEEFIADGVIYLKYTDDLRFPTRSLRVKKLRGIKFLSKPAFYTINDSGIKLFIEGAKKLDYESSSEKVPTGIEGFDKLVFGGLNDKSSILISGPSGGGKSLFSMQTIVTNLALGKKCMYISHEESKDQLIRNSKTFGWDIEHYLDKGLFEIVAIHPEEVHLVELRHIVRSKINSFSPEIAVFDSLTAIESSYDKNEVHQYASELIAHLKSSGILSLFLNATTSLVGEIVASSAGISSLFDQIIMLRYVEVDAEFQHAIVIIKMRGGKHDKRMYKIEFGEKGLRVTNSFSGFQGIFSGEAKQISKSKEERLRQLFFEVLGPIGDVVFDELIAEGLTQDSVIKLADENFEDGVLGLDKKNEFTKKVVDIFEGQYEQ